MGHIHGRRLTSGEPASTCPSTVLFLDTKYFTSDNQLRYEDGALLTVLLLLALEILVVVVVMMGAVVVGGVYATDTFDLVFLCSRVYGV